MTPPRDLPFPGTPPSAWEAGFVAVPITVETEPDARPTALLVTDGGALLFQELVLHPPTEPEEVAREIERAVLEGARSKGHLPERLRVRHPSVARLLAPVLAPREVEVKVADDLRYLAAIATDLRGHLNGLRDAPDAASPETWAGWGLPPARVEEIFAAAAAFHRAAPWRELDDEHLLRVETPEGRQWTVCVLGHGDIQYGIVLYEDVADYVGMLVRDAAPGADIGGLQGAVVSLAFEPAPELREAMRREVRGAGWEVASPAAYPRLTVQNTPGYGVDRAQAEDLVRVLRAVPAFVERHRDILRAGLLLPGDSWLDPGTGLVLAPSEIVWGSPGGRGLWDPPVRLDPACAEGAGADPAAALLLPDDPDAFVEAEEGVVARFRAWLAREGLSPATVSRHAASAGRFVEYLSLWAVVPVRAVTEYDLRCFLFDWYPARSEDARKRVLSLPGSLRRFFEFLAQAERIECPWSRAVLHDRAAFEIHYDEFPGGEWWEPEVQEWRSELYDDLLARALVPSRPLGDGGGEGEVPGPVEARLFVEISRRWLLWRDEVVRAGTTEPEAVRRALDARQREWERAKHPGLGGKTPLQAIRAERKQAKPKKHG